MKQPVACPEGTVVYRKSAGSYVYITVDKEYKKDKKYNVNKRVSIGKLCDDHVHMIPNRNYYEFCAGEGELPEAPIQDDTLRTGLYVVMKELMKENSLDTLIDNAYKDDAPLMEDLILYMIQTEDDAMQYFPDYGQEHILFSDLIHSDSDISEMFKRQTKQQHEYFLNNWNQLHNSAESIYISYDSTNMNTRAEGIELAEYGPAKDDDTLPDVNFSLAYDQDNGVPYYYELYQGSIIDNTQCTFMVDRAKSYGYRNVGFLLDRGYFSTHNIQYFDKNGYEFILMAKRNAKFVQSAVEEVSMRLKLGSEEYYLPEHEVFGTTVKQKMYPSDAKKRFLHVYYDGARAYSETVAYMSRLKHNDEELEKRLNKKLTRAQDLKAYEKYYTLKFDDKGYFLSYTRKKSAIQKHLDRLGFFVIVTSKEMKASEALDKYRHRDSIEKLFRTDKSYLGMDALRVCTDESLESKTMLSFLAIIIRNDLFNKLKPLYVKDRKNYTVPAAIRELNKLSISIGADGRYRQFYALSKKQKAILETCRITPSEYSAQIKRICAKLPARMI